MATRTIDLILQMQTDQAALNKTNAGVKKVEKSLKDVEQQANRTREKMEKLAQVGNRLALVGGAITAPFILAMKKYVETAKDSEGTSARIIALQKKWEEFKASALAASPFVGMTLIQKVSKTLEIEHEKLRNDAKDKAESKRYIHDNSYTNEPRRWVLEVSSR